MMAMSNFGETLIICSFETNAILLNIWFFLIIFSTTTDIIGVLVFSTRYKIPMILRYNFDYGKQETLTSLALIQFAFLI